MGKPVELESFSALTKYTEEIPGLTFSEARFNNNHGRFIGLLEFSSNQKITFLINPWVNEAKGGRS